MTKGDQHTSLFTVVQQHEAWGEQILQLQQQVTKLEEEQGTAQQYSRLNQMEICEEAKTEAGKGSKQLTKPPPSVLTESEQVVHQDSQTSAFIGEVGSQEA